MPLMSDPPENPVLDCLRRLEARMDRVLDEIGDLRRHLTILEGRIANLATKPQGPGEGQ